MDSPKLYKIQYFIFIIRPYLKKIARFKIYTSKIYTSINSAKNYLIIY